MFHLNALVLLTLENLSDDKLILPMFRLVLIAPRRTMVVSDVGMISLPSELSGREPSLLHVNVND